MAYIVMAYIVLAYTVTAYIVSLPQKRRGLSAGEGDEQDEVQDDEDLLRHLEVVVLVDPRQLLEERLLLELGPCQTKPITT